jgi:8-amino-7-oxononanoate synthase
MTLEERWQAQLDLLRRQGRYRSLNPPRGIDFSSNDYLGYGKRFWSNIDDLSRSGQASRLLRGHHEIWDEVEARLADWHGAEAALMMTSGYVANEGLLSTVIEPQDWVASDEFNHASIIDGLRLSKAERFVYRHNAEMQYLDGLRTAKMSADPNRRWFHVSESLFGMEGDISAELRVRKNWLFEDLKVGVCTIVDEAHATGCTGPRGAGLSREHVRRSRSVQATVHTGGKALGVAGAYICCSKLLKEYLVNRCRHLLFTTALPPALGRWWLDAVERVQRDDSARARLEENTATFRGALARHGIRAKGEHYIVPIILGDDESAVRAAQSLQNEGFDVRAIRPPTVPPGTARLRISIHSDHHRPMLLALAEAVARTLKQTL